MAPSTSRGGFHHRKITGAHVNFLADKLADNCNMTLKEIAELVDDEYHVSMSVETVRRALSGACFTIKKITATTTAAIRRQARTSAVKSRFGSFTAIECNAFVERLLRHIGQTHDLAEVVLVVDNAPCHTNVEAITEDDEFASASIIKLGPYLPMLNPIENVISTYKSAVKRFLARNRKVIKRVPPYLTITAHRSRLLQIAADLILPEVVTEELCRPCSRHTAPFHLLALERADMPVGQ